jgi:phosphotransferase system enzyme I (PtsI)
MPERSDHAEVSYRGIGLSGGVALGTAHVRTAASAAEFTGLSAPSRGQATETGRLLRAIQRASSGLDQVIADVSRRIGPAESLIFKVQQAILGDPTLIGQVTGKIETEGLSAEAALVDVLSFYEARISELDDAYVRERGSDIAEVRRRVLDEFRAEAAPTQATERPTPASAAKREGPRYRRAYPEHDGGRGS